MERYMMLSRGARPTINNESRSSTVLYELSNQDEGGRTKTPSDTTQLNSVAVGQSKVSRRMPILRTELLSVINKMQTMAIASRPDSEEEHPHSTHAHQSSGTSTEYLGPRCCCPPAPKKAFRGWRSAAGNCVPGACREGQTRQDGEAGQAPHE